MPPNDSGADEHCSNEGGRQKAFPCKTFFSYASYCSYTYVINQTAHNGSYVMDHKSRAFQHQPVSASAPTTINKSTKIWTLFKNFPP